MIQKKQVSRDNGNTWADVSPLETRLGYVTGMHDTYSECASETPIPPSGYTSQYLTFEIVSSGTIVWKSNADCESKTISYSRDNGTIWTEITSSTAGTSFNVSAGDKIIFKGTNSSYGGACNGPVVGFGTFGGSTASFYVYGNIMSLIYGDNFMNQTQFPSGSEDNFNSLFASASTVLGAENLILPVTALTYGCYSDMFRGCNKLVIPPALPATTLAPTCYGGMFAGCTLLSTAPELPSTTLARNCYYQMFDGCASLMEGPDLPAPTLLRGSYTQMFRNCTSLIYIKCLATDISADMCTLDWLRNVSYRGDFYKPSSMSSWPRGGSGIPTSWSAHNI